MMCVGEYEIKTPTHKNFIGKNKCIHSNSRLEI